MTLEDFLIARRSEILNSGEKTFLSLAALRPSSNKLESGLPLFFDQLVDVLKKHLDKVMDKDESAITQIATLHGRELLRLGYTLTHVVHSYGALCQAVTEVASLFHVPVTAMEFHLLNRCLDIAIAGAVTEFESIRNLENKNKEVMHLGAVAHELRNALNRAQISFEMLSKGIVGLGGSTSRVLEFSLKEMGVLISRSLAEVRLRADTDLNDEHFSMIELISQLVVTAQVEAAQKQQTLGVDVDPTMYVKTDRHLILGAIGNLVQNAMKFTKHGGHISITGERKDQNVMVSVQDQGGGIQPEKMAELFKPFVQHNADRTGLGLGLMISKQAIEKCGGSLGVRNTDEGCKFTVSLPFQEFPTLKTSAHIV